MYEAFRLIEEFENAKKTSGAYLLECLFSEMDRNLLNESNKKLLVGNFDTLSPYMPNGPIYRTRWISLKGKSNHKIKDVDKFITEVLSNIDFATWYEDGKKLNFYSQSTNSLGETKYKQIGVAVKDRCATTAFVIPQSRYQSAYNNRIRK